MDQCESWMTDPTVKCLYWGLILIVLIMVVYYLRNPQGFQNQILTGCAHGQCKRLDEVNKLFNERDFGYATVVRSSGDGNEEPFQSGPSSSNGMLEGCAHGQCKDPNRANALFRKAPLGYGSVVEKTEHFKLPPGSGSVSGPSREALLDIEGYGDAGRGFEVDPLQAAIAGGSALNARPGTMFG